MEHVAELKGLMNTIGLVMGFCAGLTILGGLITTAGAFMLKKHLGTLKENAMLKDAAIRNSISESKAELEVKFERLRGEFLALKQRVEQSMVDQKAAVDGLSMKHERTMGVMKKAYEQTDARLKLMEEKQQKTQFLVERIVKKGG